jgi:hypothetical protein
MALGAQAQSAAFTLTSPNSANGKKIAEGDPKKNVMPPGTVQGRTRWARPRSWASMVAETAVGAGSR